MKKKKEHTKSLERMVFREKKDTAMYRNTFRTIQKVLLTSEAPQDKVFAVANIISTTEKEMCIELGKDLA